ncbi:MAG: hypothetical protein ABIJ31_14155 [Pseudomonadota bacterium]
MPGLDGNQVLNKIRQWEKFRNIVPEERAKVILLSVEALKAGVQNALKAGDQACLVKPVTRTKPAAAFRQTHYI